MSLMTVEPGVKPGFFVARFLLSQLTNLTHSPRVGVLPVSFPWKPLPGTGSVSWSAAGWSGSLLRRGFSSLGRSTTLAICPAPQGRGNNREALPVNSLLIDSYSARSVQSSVAYLIRHINNMERRILYEHAA